MQLIAVALIAVLLVAVVLVIARPLRSGATGRDRSPSAGAGGGDGERAELEALREAKYREIRDAELDFRTGKLSEEDYRALDRGLRAEAIDILRRLDALD